MDRNPRMNVQCKLYKAGRCWYGQNCKYAHENGDQFNVAKNLDRGKCKTVTKVRQCRSFLSGEGCPYGQNCHFLHEDSAPSRKTRICHNWEETGSCSFGKSCIYAHGKEELLRSFGSQLETHPEVVSGSRIQSLPKGSNCEKNKKCLFKLKSYEQLNGPSCDEDKKRLFKLKTFKQLNRIYADWIDEMDI